MAEYAYNQPIVPPQVVDPMEDRINHTIDRLIYLLNVRRTELLQAHHNAREDKRAEEANRHGMITQLTEARTQLETTLTGNPLQEMLERSLQEIRNKLENLRTDIPVETRFEWTCETEELERNIARLGDIAQIPIGVPEYSTFQTAAIATGKEGSCPGEFSTPSGVAVHKDTNRIFVANWSNDRVDIFSQDGEYQNQLGEGELASPCGLAIHDDRLYVSSPSEHTISKYSLTDMRQVEKTGGKGSGEGQFNCPRYLSTDSSGLVYVADRSNNRICILDSDLNFVRNIKHQSLSKPYAVQVARDRMYALCPNSNPCMLEFSLEGEMLRSLIPRGQGTDVFSPFFFCLDRLNNFVLTDYCTHSIRVLSPDGNLIHTVGREGHERGTFNVPRGVAITPDGRLICVSENENFGLQIFC